VDEAKGLAIAAAAGAVAALAVGWRVDAMLEPSQPVLFWCFLAFGLSGCALGWRARARLDESAVRQCVALIAALLAWRLAYFPLMVICGWLASVGEWAAFRAFGRSVVYPSFALLLLAVNAAIAWIAAAAVTVARPAPPSFRERTLERLLRNPPRLALLGLGAAALPVAAMVTFSAPSDRTWFRDRPWSEPRPLPPIHDPERNPYAIILREHELGLPSQVLAFNALVTYPLVPEGPWGSAMKGTLEALALAKPIATSQDRIDEHYLAYLAAHARLHPERAEKRVAPPRPHAASHGTESPEDRQ
jgi:hypothetical protein